MRYNYSGEIYNSIINSNVKDFLDYSLIEKLSFDSTEGMVLQGMEYRPDKISEYYLGSSSYAWAITLINKFSEGVKEYTLFRKIKIPSLNTLRDNNF